MFLLYFNLEDTFVALQVVVFLFCCWLIFLKSRSFENAEYSSLQHLAKNNLGTRSESCDCILHFSKAERGQRVTGHNNGRKSRLHSQPFALSKQTRTSLPLIPHWWHTHKRTHFLSRTDSSAWPTPGGRVKSQRCSRGLTGGHESPHMPAPEHSGQVVCRTSLQESGSVLWWNLGSSILERTQGHWEHKERHAGEGLDALKALNPNN